MVGAALATGTGDPLDELETFQGDEIEPAQPALHPEYAVERACDTAGGAKRIRVRGRIQLHAASVRIDLLPFVVRERDARGHVVERSLDTRRGLP